MTPSPLLTSLSPSANNEFGDKMMAAEEVLVASGLPYVILRCGDLIGPRDTTYRLDRALTNYFTVPRELI